jgi:hypothetical protein
MNDFSLLSKLKKDNYISSLTKTNTQNSEEAKFRKMPQNNIK